MRPSQICRQLLMALDASEGLRRRRKRNTTPDVLGMAIKRRLLEEAARADPDAEAFEGWLLERSLSGMEVNADDGDDSFIVASGPVRAVAQEILAEWQLAQISGSLRDWLSDGAPSDDSES